ncbi:MAG: hypothetical protein AABX77_03630, partial [Nanoarchaeota archaeon]
GTSNDRARFIDVATSSIIDTVWTAEGTGTLTIGGISYVVTMTGSADLPSEIINVKLNYPDSSGANNMIVYPTIQTSLGAKVMFYEPLEINLTNWDNGEYYYDYSRRIYRINELEQLMIPDGDGYTVTYFTRA